jgi:penicillin-binding protein 1A
VWVGRDDGEPLGLHGGEAAAPIWKRFMERAWKARPPHEVERPRRIVEVTLDPKTGLRVRRGKRGAEIELFRRRAIPPSKRFWRRPTPVIH